MTAAPRPGFEPFPAAALDRSIGDRFDRMVARHPGRPAVADLSVRLTYAELAALAGRISATVRAATAGRPGPVAILLDHEARFPAAFLGVLKAGRAMVPLEADHPPDRNRQIARHATAAALVSAGRLAREARGLFPPDLPVLDLDRLDPLPEDTGGPAPGPDDLAYILYTSGSTGRPKGVAHSHRNALNDTLVATDALAIGPGDRMTAFASSVMGGIRDYLGALLTGAAVEILPPRILGADGLAREIRARGVTVYRSVPTLFRRVAEAVAPGERLDRVRLVRLSGERVDWSDIDTFRRVCPPAARFGVGLGSTEVSSMYAQWLVDESLRGQGGRLPVGRVVPGVTVSVVDAEGRALPDGEVGEFVVAGRHLALGYWRDPELTAASFEDDPDEPGRRRFRTGDMGLRRPDGLLEFVGRQDQLVKLRGHRIEPAEVEATLRGCSGLSDAAVVVRRDATGRPRALVAYVERAPGVRGLLPRHVLAMASQALPAYMVPSAAFVLESLPRLPTLKIDRVALAGLDAAARDGRSERAADPLLDRVACAFEAVVRCDDATPDDNLLSLGGDSLQAVAVILELERVLGVAVPAAVFAESPSIRALAAWIGRAGEAA